MKHYLSLLIIAFLFICQACEKKEPKPEETLQEVVMRFENYEESLDPLHIDHLYKGNGREIIRENVLVKGYSNTISVVVGAKLTLYYRSNYPEERVGHFSINDIDYTLDMTKDTTFTVTVDHEYL